MSDINVMMLVVASGIVVLSFAVGLDAIIHRRADDD